MGTKDNLLCLIIYSLVCCHGYPYCPRNTGLFKLLREGQLEIRTMQLVYLINLICIFAVNVLFFFSGICLNCLVIVSFWRSAHLRKKLCYFMITILSCCDLLVVLTCHPWTAVHVMFRLTGSVNVYSRWWDAFFDTLSNILLGFSLLALLVMNFDRYLATYYPVYHRTSVTKGKLLILHGILNILGVTFLMLTAYNIILSFDVGVLMCLGVLCPPMLFVNYKLFTIAKKNRRNNAISTEVRKTFSMKNVSSCLLSVACFVVLSIPAFVHGGLRMTTRDTLILDSAYIVGLWAHTIAAMNSTCNCLIFYWKNKILRAEGRKVLKGLKFGG